MTLVAGTRLGPYEITGALGAGGMGEVYRARDPRLGRDVAIKVLPSALASDGDRLRRFEQEARAAAALNHPNILAVYDIGIRPPSNEQPAAPFVVMELLEGTTLRERLAGGALPARRAAEYGAQIARGLAAAHEKGIVHRDLKPENVFVTPDERVKILDFGLAKLAGPAAADVSQLATLSPSTTPGVVMGTVGYMAPEQARGEIADHRADIFALGCVLYEMLAGRRPFESATAAETMTAILREDPAELPLDRTPPGFARIVTRCLEKSPAARFKSADDLSFALDSLSSGGSGTVERAPISTPRGRRRLALVAVGAVAVAAALLAGMAIGGRPVAPAELPQLRFTIPVPDGWRFETPDSAYTGPIAVSPDGRRVAFVARNTEGQTLLWVRALDSLEARPLAGTEGASNPFWSPDGEWLGFLTERALNKVRVAGGEPIRICDIPGATNGATWLAGDTIVLVGGAQQPLQRVSAGGGEPIPETVLGEDEQLHRHPTWIRGTDRFLYTVFTSQRERKVYMARLGSAGRTFIADIESSGVMHANGHLIILRGTTLVAQPLDVERGALVGEPISLAQGVREQTQGTVLAAIGHVSDHVLVYQEASRGGDFQLVWFDRSGRELGRLGDRGTNHNNLELSSDGTRLLAGLLDPARRTRDIWAIDVARGIRTRLTFDPAEERSASWSPDGRQVVFNSNRVNGTFELYRKSASGTGQEASLLIDRRSKDSNGWTADGRFLLYRVTGDTGTNDLWALPMTGDQKPYPLVATPFDEPHGRFSPDARWLAYSSDETGRGEVYVTSFPDSGGRWPVSSNGGAFPRWRDDGRELYFIAPDGMLKAVEVDGTRAEFKPGLPRDLFRMTLAPGSFYPYVVTSDGQRFLVNTDMAPPTPLTVVVNWAQSLGGAE